MELVITDTQPTANSGWELNKIDEGQTAELFRIHSDFDDDRKILFKQECLIKNNDTTFVHVAKKNKVLVTTQVTSPEIPVELAILPSQLALTWTFVYTGEDGKVKVNDKFLASINAFSMENDSQNIGDGFSKFTVSSPWLLKGAFEVDMISFHLEKTVSTYQDSETVVYGKRDMLKGRDVALFAHFRKGIPITEETETMGARSALPTNDDVLPVNAQTNGAEFTYPVSAGWFLTHLRIVRLDAQILSGN
jgi:hypothetical protein